MYFVGLALFHLESVSLKPCSSTHGGLKSKTYVATKKGKIYLRHNSIHEDVPIVIALKALGIQSDKEILLLTAGNSDAYASAFSPNLEEAAKLGVYTKQQALEYIGARVKVNRKVVGARRPYWEEALEALATIVLAHVPVANLDFSAKAVFVATMTRRVLMAMDDEKMVDDRDYVGNKRLELCVAPVQTPESCADGQRQRWSAARAAVRRSVQDFQLQSQGRHR